MSDPNKLTQSLRDLIEKWRKVTEHYSAFDDRADELESLLPSIDREIEAAQAVALREASEYCSNRAKKLSLYRGAYASEEAVNIDRLRFAQTQLGLLNDEILVLIGSKQASLEAHDAELRRRWEGEK